MYWPAECQAAQRGARIRTWSPSADVRSILCGGGSYPTNRNGALTWSWPWLSFPLPDMCYEAFQQPGVRCGAREEVEGWQTARRPQVRPQRCVFDSFAGLELGRDPAMQDCVSACTCHAA
jgi:hypothetical protein